MRTVRFRRVSSMDDHVLNTAEPARLRGRNVLALVLFLVVFAFYTNNHFNEQVPLERVEKVERWKAKLVKENLQTRSNVHLGSPSDGFRLENQLKLAKRRKDMQELDEVRLRYCGDLRTGRWKQRKLAPASVMYFNDTVNYATTITAVSYKQKAFSEYSSHFESRTFKRWLCDGKHPRLHNTNVRIERLGPFYSNGNNDWNTVFPIDNVLGLADEFRSKPLYVTGRMFATVYPNGSLVGYPPLHTHHAHIYPDRESRMKKKVLPKEMRKRFNVQKEDISHHVLIQAHGDSICKDEDGGLHCLLDQLPDGHAYRVVNTSGFDANFEINDVRPRGSAQLEFYVDVALVYTREHRIETTFLQMGNPFVGLGWNTYQMPLDPSSNVMFFNLTNKFFGSGVLNDFILHTHMSHFDSIYVFKGTRIYQHLDNYRRKSNSSLPMVFDCLPPHMNSSRADILKQIARLGDTELVCEGVKPSVQLYCSYKTACIYRDKRIQFNCRQNVRFEVNETLTVVAFNTVRNVSSQPITRNSKAEELAIISPFGGGYTATQHSFFRVNFVSDRARNGQIRPSTGEAMKDVALGAYAPPSMFVYTPLPYPRTNMISEADRVIANCPRSINYDVDLPWNVRRDTT